MKIMIERADRVVGLASHEKLGTVAPFTIAPATQLTHIATDAPLDVLAPFEELGLRIVR
jgi:DeoR/GlpR family transcriptional regulator of sugar metabolism